MLTFALLQTSSFVLCAIIQAIAYARWRLKSREDKLHDWQEYVSSTFPAVIICNI